MVHRVHRRRKVCTGTRTAARTRTVRRAGGQAADAGDASGGAAVACRWPSAPTRQAAVGSPDAQELPDAAAQLRVPGGRRVERLLGEVDAERVEPAVDQGVRVDGQPALPLLVGEHPAARLAALGRPGQVEEPHPRVRGDRAQGLRQLGERHRSRPRGVGAAVGAALRRRAHRSCVRSTAPRRKPAPACSRCRRTRRPASPRARRPRPPRPSGPSPRAARATAGPPSPGSPAPPGRGTRGCRRSRSAPAPGRRSRPPAAPRP